MSRGEIVLSQRGFSPQGGFNQAERLERVSISSLLPADSPRVDGENSEHARLLAESDESLPPIIVQRSTLRVIDGMHRLRAAKLRGLTEIHVRFYEGDDDDAFVLAVEANNSHGLPLSLVDRTSAAERIIAACPNWSDRKVASIVRLSATTVGSIRRRSTDRSGHLNPTSRLGRDGKLRPLNVAEGRRRASELLKDHPDASVREIARAAGVSTGTVVNIRNRLRDGRDERPHELPSREVPAPPLQRSSSPEDDVQVIEDSGTESHLMLETLKRDPSLRFTDAGRTLLRLLDMNSVGLRQGRYFVDSVPEHCLQAIAKLAHRHSQAWHQMALYLERRLNTER